MMENYFETFSDNRTISEEEMVESWKKLFQEVDYVCVSPLASEEIIDYYKHKKEE